MWLVTVRHDITIAVCEDIIEARVYDLTDDVIDDVLHDDLTIAQSL